MLKKSLYLFFVLLLLFAGPVWSANQSPQNLFGYQQIEKQNLNLFPQWLSVLERQLLTVSNTDSCQSSQFNQCHLQNWQDFLEKIKHLSVLKQIKQVNKYANQKAYILDVENYGIADYWATPKEFLINNGDCEDYAIIKMLSMKWLGYDASLMRVVVVQDTNLKTPHAVMMIKNNNDYLILDNQIEEVISHLDIFHYVPVYSVNETNWWMYVPN